MYVCVNRSFTWEPLDAETRNKSSKARYCLDHGGGGSKWGPCIFLSPNYWLEPKEAITHYDVYHFCVNCYVFHDFVSWWLAVVNNMLEPKGISQQWISVNYLSKLTHEYNIKPNKPSRNHIILFFIYRLFSQWGVPIRRLGLASGSEQTQGWLIMVYNDSTSCSTRTKCI